MTRRIACLASLLLALGSAPASATSSDFVVRITSLSDDFGTGLAVGSLVKGHFSNGNCSDPFCLDYYNPTANVGSYYDLGVSGSVDLEAFLVETDGTFVQSDVGIWNDFSPSSYDRFMVEKIVEDPSITPYPFPPGPSYDEFYLIFGLHLVDLDGTVFDDAHIPEELPPLNRFEEAEFSLSFSRTLYDNDYNVLDQRGLSLTGEIVHLPEPASAVMAGCGLALLAAHRRQRRRRR